MINLEGFVEKVAGLSTAPTCQRPQLTTAGIRILPRKVKQRLELHDLSSFDSPLLAEIVTLDSPVPFITRANLAVIGSWRASVSVGNFAA